MVEESRDGQREISAGKELFEMEKSGDALGKLMM